MKKILCLKSTFITFLLFLTITVSAHSENVQRHVVMTGTRYETSYYVKTGAQPGPTVMVIGGLHGDEKAGYLAARKIVNWKITKGRLIVMPDANREAIERDVRFYQENMNNMFPGKKEGTNMERLAYEIWQVIKTNKPDLLLTLHESRDFHANNPARFGQTFCFDFDQLIPLMQPVLKQVNANISPRLHQFQIFVDPYPHCPTYNAWKKLHIPATSIETSRTLPLATRVHYQLLAVQGFCDGWKLGYQQNDVPSTSPVSIEESVSTRDRIRGNSSTSKTSTSENSPSSVKSTAIPVKNKTSSLLFAIAGLGALVGLFLIQKHHLKRRS